MIKKLAAFFLKIEALISSLLLCLISVLVFVSAVTRTVGRPINWTQDVSLLAFAWLTFLGADVLAKSGKLINIDMVLYKLPKSVQKVLGIVFDLMILAFLAVLVVYGYKLVSQSWRRMFNTLKLSYAWCTMAVPVGTFLLFMTMLRRTWDDIRRPVEDWGQN